MARSRKYFKMILSKVEKLGFFDSSLMMNRSLLELYFLFKGSLRLEPNIISVITYILFFTLSFTRIIECINNSKEMNTNSIGYSSTK